MKLSKCCKAKVDEIRMMMKEDVTGKEDNIGDNATCRLCYRCSKCRAIDCNVQIEVIDQQEPKEEDWEIKNTARMIACLSGRLDTTSGIEVFLDGFRSSQKQKLIEELKKEISELSFDYKIHANSLTCYRECQEEVLEILDNKLKHD